MIAHKCQMSSQKLHSGLVKLAVQYCGVKLMMTTQLLMQSLLNQAK